MSLLEQIISANNRQSGVFLQPPIRNRLGINRRRIRTCRCDRCIPRFRYHLVPFASHFSRYLVISIICDVMCYRSLLTLFQPFILFFFIHLSLELVGETKQKDQAKIQFESKVRTPNMQDLKKKSGRNQTQSRFKDLLEEDSEEESRPDPNHILAFTMFTKTNHQLPASSVTINVIVINDMHIGMKQKTFFPLPKIKQDFSKRRIYEKSPAQQGSTLKRNFKIILTVSKAQVFFFFFFFFQKKGTSYNLCV